MSNGINRREFIAKSVGAAGVIGAVGIPLEASASSSKQSGSSHPKKACLFGMLPENLSLEDRFKLAKDVGFEGVEAPPVDGMEAEKMRTASDKAGIRIHSVIFGGWGAPLSSGDPAIIERGLKEAKSAIHGAKIMGADSILLVPAIVDANTRYEDAYKRSHENVRKLIPYAEEHQILICIEEVWNNFLLSPMEYVKYIDDFKSKWVQSYFDVGNVVAFAWPQDWIRTVGKRIHKVHLKDYKGGPGLFGSRGGNFVNLREGSIDWPEVRKAFSEIGYSGYMTTELGGGDEAYLRDVVSRVDKIFAGV